MLGTDEDSVVEARDHALDVVANEMGIEGDDRHDQVRALLAELPADEWSGVVPIVGEDEATPADDPGEELDAMATAGPDTALFEEAEYELETDRVLEEAEALEHDRLEIPPEYVPREELAPAEDAEDPDDIAEPDEGEEPEAAEDDEPAAAEDPVPATAERRDGQPEEKRRPRRLALLGLLTALVAVGVLLALLAGGDDDTDPTPRDAGRESTPAAPPGDGSEPRGTAARLEPVGDAAPRARATARLTDDGRRLTLSARGLPAPGEGAYTVWLYNSVIDARALGSGRDTISLDAKLPGKLARYRFVDISFEPADRNPNHSGRSVLRVPTEALLKK